MFRMILLVVLGAGFAGGASAAAGRAEFVVGGVTVARDGQARPLARGAELDTGDVVRTNEGRAQIRFADGAYVSLQPESEFNITEYRFAGRADGSERGFFGLLKGAMRTVTGAIGRVNRGSYRVSTPTATIGIRGTGGVIQVLPDGATLVIGTSGTWFVANPAGTLDVPAGTSVLAPADQRQPPRESATRPSSGPAPLPPEPALVEQGEQLNALGTPVGLIAPLLSGTGYAAAAAFGSFDSSIILDGDGVVTAEFNPSGEMTRMLFSSLNEYVLVAGKHAEFGTDGILAWGRWIGDVTVPIDGSIAQTYSENQGMHYVVGMPTPVMPVTGSATYSVLGATSPTYASGKTAPGSFSGSLNVDFGAATLGMDMKVAMPDGNGYHLAGNASARSSLFSADTFSQSLSIQGTSGVACTGTGGCSGAVKGFFSGLSAERVGLGYQIQDAMTGEIAGAAAFRKQ